MRWIPYGVGLGLALALLAAHATLSLAEPEPSRIPGAASRSSVQNYKDMLLARCLAVAYQESRHVADDAGSTASVLVEWTDFDAEHSLAASDALIQQYLSRTYRNPLREYRDVKFELLKCLDLYHSKELAQHVNRYVGRTRAKAGSK